MAGLNFGQLMGADFGVPTSPTFNQPYSFPAAGAAPAGGFNWGQAAGMMGLANMGLGIMGQSNTARSAQSAYNTAGIMSDINFGRDLFALNKDISEQKLGRAWGDAYQANNPFFRQNQLNQNLQNVAGRWGAFLAG